MPFTLHVLGEIYLIIFTDPDLSINKQKSKKNLDFYYQYFVTYVIFEYSGKCTFKK